MIAEETKRILSVVLSIVLATGSSEVVFGYQAPEPAPATDSGGATATAPMAASELQALVAPIALYPDPLVAQILAAATFPDQVAVANYWVEQNKSLTGTALEQAVDKQTWDASVKALTQFPSVLDNMSKNLSWTSSLGEAYHNQQSDVMAAVQTLRAQAKAAGNLKSTSQIVVQQPAPQTIVIQPANPQIVYVPQYNPAVIYGTPYVTPGYSTGALVATGLLSFGAGIAVGAMMSGGGWGWNSWGCNWHGGVVVYNHNNFYGNSAWHGGYYNGGYHGNGYNNYNRNGYNNNYNHNGSNYNRNGNNTFNKNVSGNTVNVNRQSAQNFNKQSAQNFGSSHPSASNSWAQHDSSAGKSDAFSGMSGKSGGSGGGWSSRADSSRGWGSMHSSGFSGGRFGGGGGGFGGGGFRGGGGRR